MLDEDSFTLRQVDPARADFYAIERELDVIKAQLACRRERIYETVSRRFRKLSNAD
jgi:hypothetical protein